MVKVCVFQTYFQDIFAGLGSLYLLAGLLLMLGYYLSTTVVHDMGGIV